MELIESIGKHGVKTTHGDLLFMRMSKPKSGDIVDFGENEGTFPFSQRYGRIWSTNHWDTGTMCVCCEMGSAFLRDDGSVDISGGPFVSIMPDELEPTMGLKQGRYWNWGNNMPGADKGVYYTFERPVFRLKKRTDDDKARVNEAFRTDI